MCGLVHARAIGHFEALGRLYFGNGDENEVENDEDNEDDKNLELNHNSKDDSDNDKNHAEESEEKTDGRGFTVLELRYKPFTPDL